MIKSETVVVVLVALATFLVVSDTMRESDQASILDGAVQIFRGDALPWPTDFYNYDKQFVSYGVIVAALKLGELCMDGEVLTPERVVYLGNLSAWAVFWTGMIALAHAWGRGELRTACLLLVILLSPCLLLNAPLFATIIVSAGFTAMLAALFRRRGRMRVWELAMAAVLAFLAVGARADAVLLLPFLCWVTACPGRWRRLVSARRHWAAFAGAVTALLVGRVIMIHEAGFMYAPFFVGKVFAAYVVFGLGAGFAVLLYLSGLLAAAAVWGRKRAVSRRLFWAAGLLMLAAPFAFYSVQLFTPRHFVAVSGLLAIMVVTRRGRALRAVIVTERCETPIVAVALAGAMVPMAFGIYLPTLATPGLVMRDSTLYPTTDGFWPMGAYVDFMFKLRGASRQAIDHDQLVWRAFNRADLPDVSGVVPFYWSQLKSIEELATTLQGKRSSFDFAENEAVYPYVIGDERMLRRSGKLIAGDWPGVREGVDELKKYPKEVFFEDPGGERILRIDLRGPDSRGFSDERLEKRLALAQVFGGDDYRVREGALTSVGGAGPDHGRLVLMFGDAPFHVTVREPGKRDGETLAAEELGYEVPGKGSAVLYFVALTPDRTLERKELSYDVPADGIDAAVGLLPGYMSFRRL